MPSFKSRLFIFALKYQHLLRFQLKRTSAITWETSIPELRAKTEKSTGIMGKLPEDIEKKELLIEGHLTAIWLLPKQDKKNKVILYFHGGGYVLGSAKSHVGVVAKFVKGSGIGALVFDYRLAPENPFPAGLEDALTAYLYLLDQGISPSDIIFSGDSAGGGLLLAVLLALKDKSMPLPAAAVALSPWTDLLNTGQSVISNQNVDPLTWRDSWDIFSKYYAADNNPSNPWISPLYGSLQGLPPLLIFAGGDELLRDDSIRFAEKAKASGVDVTLRIGKGMFHCYPACSPLFPEAKVAMDEICSFIRRHAAKQETLNQES